MRKRRIAFILVFAMLLQLVPLPQGVLAGIGDLFPKTEAAVGGYTIDRGTTGTLKWSIVEEEKKPGWLSSSFRAYKLTITGTGSMLDYNIESYKEDGSLHFKTAAPWKEYALGIQTVEISDGVTNISQNAFYGCNAMTSITIPSGVTQIGDSAFEECTALKSVSLPEGLQTLGSGVFERCTELTSVDIPSSLTSIGNTAFYMCTNLKSILLGNSKIKQIPLWAFCSCSNLSEVTLPDTITEISSNAFGSCHNLSEITLPNSLETIAEGAFAETSIRELVIPKSVTQIVGNPCRDDKQLQTIKVDSENKNYVSINNILVELRGGKYYKTLCYPCNAKNDIVVPAPTVEIGDYAFQATAAQNITLPASLKTIGSSAFMEANLTYCAISNKL